MKKLSIVKLTSVLFLFRVGNDTWMTEMLDWFRVLNIINISRVNAKVIFPSMDACIFVYCINDSLSSKIKDTY